MSTTGVKRVGKGYQSDNVAAISNIPRPKVSGRLQKRSSNFFLAGGRRQMPPPVSSEDLRRRSQSVGPDEFGSVSTVPSSGSDTVGSKGDKSDESLGIVRRALKAITVKR